MEYLLAYDSPYDSGTADRERGISTEPPVAIPDRCVFPNLIILIKSFGVLFERSVNTKIQLEEIPRESIIIM